MDGEVHIAARLPGDADGDGALNNKDYVLLQRYIVGWDVDVSTEACDVNKDGKLNNRDLVLILRYLNGWDVDLY